MSVQTYRQEATTRTITTDHYSVHIPTGQVTNNPTTKTQRTEETWSVDIPCREDAPFSYGTRETCIQEITELINELQAALSNMKHGWEYPI